MTIPRMPSSRTPSIDRVVTRNFKFFAVTDSTPTSAQGCLIGNVKDTFASNNIALRLTNIPGITRMKDIFTFYRFERVTFRFIASTVTQITEDADTGTSASSISKVTPRFYCTRVWGNEPGSQFTWAGEDSCMIDGNRGVKMTRGTKISWVPNTLQPVQTSRAPLASSSTQPPTTGWLPKRKIWCSLQDDEIIWYGLKWATSSTSHDTNEFLYKVLITAKISFKGLEDSNYTQSAGGGTVLIPFTSLTT